MSAEQLAAANETIKRLEREAANRSKDEECLATMGRAIGAEIAKKDHSVVGGGSRRVGLAPEGAQPPAANKADICRALAEDTIFPPISLLDDQVITDLAAHNTIFLAAQHTPKDVSNVRKLYEPYVEANHLLPPVRLFAAVLKFGNLVSEIIATTDASKKYVKADFAKFIADVSSRSVGEGNFRVAREYTLLRLDNWKAGLECDPPLEFNHNTLSKFEPALWDQAIIGAGARSQQDLLRRDETKGTTQTAWGTVVKIISSTTTKAAEKVRSIVNEDKDIGADILQGMKTE
ncbi:hypothetical protein JCM10213_007494, partial [Rhodosporidiobolus nylandii]